MKQQLNVFGEPLIPCCFEPNTGYLRNGFCFNLSHDTGMHLLCACMTQEFLEYTKLKGNDLSTPIPQWNFPGLKPGDFWCLCVSRWLQAERAGKAPLLKLGACHENALRYTSLDTLRKYEHKFRPDRTQ